jgi:hypothetical protein
VASFLKKKRKKRRHLGKGNPTMDNFHSATPRSFWITLEDSYFVTINYFRGVRKKPKNRENRKKIIEKTELWKKPAGSVRIWFYKPKTEKTEPNPNRKKLSQTGKKPSQAGKNRAKPKNQAKPVWTGFCPKKPNRIETGRFEPVSVRFRFFYKKIQCGYFFW